MCNYFIKRNGKRTSFDKQKLHKGILASFITIGASEQNAEELAIRVHALVDEKLNELGYDCVTAEFMQNIVCQALNKLDDAQGPLAANEFMQYARNRQEMRELRALKKTLTKLTEESAKDSDLKRENANIDGNTAMGTMLKYGSESAKSLALSELMSQDIATAHIEGDIHIHDMDFYALTETCCQIDLSKLFKHGFSTGHGVLREPGGITSASALSCIAIQANQNDQHGGQSVPCFDFYLAPYVVKTMHKEIQRCFTDSLIDTYDGDKQEVRRIVDSIMSVVYEYSKSGKSLLDGNELVGLINAIHAVINNQEYSYARISRTLKLAAEYTDKHVYQAMEAFVHNLNTMNSRAGAQVPFSSINFGTDVSPEGRSISRNLMKAIYNGLGNGETSIFPIAIFKCKKGINFFPGDPNYDLYQQALETTAKRLFPNFSFLDAPHNLQYYKPGRPETEVAYMGCRTRVISNIYDSSREVVTGRGNLSFTTINLPRLGILCNHDIDKFYAMLDEKLDLVRRQLLERLAIQQKKTVRNYPFLMGQGVWMDSDKLFEDDTLEDILKHGTLSIGFIGLAECLTAITGKHHGESSVAQEMGLQIIRHMRDYTDKLSQEMHLNWSVLATPAEGLSGRFVRMDRERFGSIPGVTDKDWYTNSFHVPVEYEITASRKIKIEGPYHALTNGGHISYIEVNGDAASNIKALDDLVHYMAENGVGYGAINHPVDRDPVCGYTGVIADVCPMCRRKECGKAEQSTLSELIRKPQGYRFTPTEAGLGVPFERIRRITGYLVGTVDRFNNAKRAELEHRTTHL